MQFFLNLPVIQKYSWDFQKNVAILFPTLNLDPWNQNL